MEKDKEKRYQSAEELYSELEKIEKGIQTTVIEGPEKKPIIREIAAVFRKPWVVILALLTLVVIVFMLVVIVRIGLLFFKREAAVPPPSEIKMLVVLPFENLGPPEDEYFAEGLTEEITSRLSFLHGLGVISRTSAKHYKGTTKTAKQIGKELGVDYVLDGTVRWDRSPEGRGRVRVTPQLIRASDDTHLWSENYDRFIEEIFSVQSEIANQVIKKLDLKVMEPERRALFAQPTDNPEAHDSYLRAGEHAALGWDNIDPKEFEHAIDLYEKATKLDPDFTLAYVSLSVTHLLTYNAGIDRRYERLERARAAIDKALELEPDSPSSKIALGLYYYYGFKDYDRALELFESVQRAWPNYTSPILGYIQRRQGKWEESVINIEKAFNLNPRSDNIAIQLGLSYLALRRYKEAEEWFNRALQIVPDSESARLSKVDLAFLSEANTREARGLLGTLPRNRMTDYNWFILYMIERKFQEAKDHLASLPYDSFYWSAFYFHRDLAYASVYCAQNELSMMKAHANKAGIVIEKALRENPNDPRLHAALGLAFAYQGLKEEAIREGNRAMELYPESRDVVEGRYYVLNIAIIYPIVGENDEAINKLEYLLSIPSGDLISIPVLKTDPQWDPLRSLPQFQRLLKD